MWMQHPGVSIHSSRCIHLEAVTVFQVIRMYHVQVLSSIPTYYTFVTISIYLLDQYRCLEKGRNILLAKKIAGPGFPFESYNKVFTYQTRPASPATFTLVQKQHASPSCPCWFRLCEGGGWVFRMPQAISSGVISSV